MNTKEIFHRTELLLGEDVMGVLSSVKVIIFGVGGVGSWCAEGLVRSGVTHLTIVDSDKVSVTNVNRQLMATVRTVGQVKVEALKARLLDINPDAEIQALQAVYNQESADSFDLDSFDYVIDAIDSLKDKALLILRASQSRAKFFCSLGAALKTDPQRVKVAEFWQVSGCPLGAALRKKLKRAGTFPAHKFLCVYDDEVLPNRWLNHECDGDDSMWNATKAQINGTTAHITAIFGMTLSGLVVDDIYKNVLKNAAQNNNQS